MPPSHFLRLFLRLFLAALLISSSTYSLAQSTEKIKTELQKQFGEKVQIKSIKPAPIAGLYEVVANNLVIYTDAQAKFLFQGDLVDLRTGVNLTEARQEEISRINWNDLPLQNAVKMVKGNGSRKIAVFADPNCGYCKRLEKTFTEMDNITVYTFLIPILAADSSTKSKMIWCSTDPAKTWVNLMVNNIAVTGKSDCNNPLEKNLSLAKSYNVTGTPAIIFTDGNRIPGAASKEDLEKKLSSLSTLSPIK